jgi:hypothetical protein
MRHDLLLRADTPSCHLPRALEILASLIRERPRRRLVECLALVLAARVVEAACCPARAMAT